MPTHTHTHTHTHKHTQIEELAPFGNLQQHLINNGNRLNIQLFHTYACQIADAMKYLEERRIVHRDLAARNILLSSEDYVCVPHSL